MTSFRRVIDITDDTQEQKQEFSLPTATPITGSEKRKSDEIHNFRRVRVLYKRNRYQAHNLANASQTHTPRSNPTAVVIGQSAPGKEKASECAIFDDGDRENGHRIVFCHGCNVQYVTSDKRHSLWWCWKCRFLPTTPDSSSAIDQLRRAPSFRLDASFSGDSRTINNPVVSQDFNTYLKDTFDPKEPLYCMHPDCFDANGRPTKAFSRKVDVVRHHKTNHENTRIDCPRPKCIRKGQNGFTRMDHLREHQRGYHGDHIPKRQNTFRGSFASPNDDELSSQTYIFEDPWA
jgi:hypothetical protein